MRIKFAFYCMLAIIGCMLVSTASAGLLTPYDLCSGAVYCNGAVDGNTDGWNIGSGYQVTDSFTVSAGTISSADVAMWLYPGDTFSSISWTICAAADGASCTLGDTIASGTNGVTLLSSDVNQYGYDLDVYSFNLGAGVSLGTGTYYLQLQNSTAANGDPVYWDENSGSSLAFENSLGSIPSESFSIFGSAPGVPEPGTMALFGSGAVLIGAGLRRKLSR